MKIAIIHLGNIVELITATSVLKYIEKIDIKTEITWVVYSEELLSVLKYNKNVKVITFEQFKESNKTYDLLINLYPYFPENLCKEITVKDVIGLNYNEEFEKYKIIFSPGKATNEFMFMNIFQLYYKLCGLKWQGEGYNFYYYPKSKTKKNRIGVSVANANLRNYILDELKLDNSKLWYVPYKKNIYRKMDELNKCDKIVTDDLLVFHLSVILRKYVYFLQTFPLKLKLEVFGKGQIINVSLDSII